MDLSVGWVWCFGVSPSCVVKLVKRANTTGDPPRRVRAVRRAEANFRRTKLFLIARFEARLDITMPKLTNEPEAYCSVRLTPPLPNN